MNERTYLGKPFDFGKQRFGFAMRISHQGGVHKDVFDPGELAVESGSQFKQACNPTVMPDVAMGGLECAGHNLKQRGFAATVWPDNACGGASLNFKTYVF